MQNINKFFPFNTMSNISTSNGGGVKPFRIPGLVAESISQDLATKLLSNIPSYEKEPTVYIKQSNTNPNRDGSQENPFNTVSEAMLYAGKFYGSYIKQLKINFLEDYTDPYQVITLTHQPFHDLYINGENFNVKLPSLRFYNGITTITNCIIEPKFNDNYGIRAYDTCYLNINNCTIDCSNLGVQTRNTIFKVGDKSVLTTYDCLIKNYTSSFANSIFTAVNNGLMYISGNFTFENMTGNIAYLIGQSDNSVVHINSVSFNVNLPNVKKYNLVRDCCLNLKGVGESVLSIATQPGFKDETSIIC